MKKIASTLIVLFAASVVMGDNYKILSMNTVNVKIGHRICKEGDVFSDKSVVFWSKDKQAFKAQNVETKKIRLFTAPGFKTKGCRTIGEYILKTKRMATRSALTLKELGQELNDTFYLLDTIRIESPVPLSSTHRYYVKFQLGNRKIERELPCDKDCFIIERSVFAFQGMTEEFLISVFFTNGSVEDDYQLTDSMKIVLLPCELD